MQKYVFRDINRNIELKAVNALNENKSTRFYCPNPNCDAHMYICTKHGSESVYFRATKPKYRHITGCNFAKSANLNLSEYEENAFIFDNAMESMLTQSNKISQNVSSNLNLVKTNKRYTTQIKTILQIYNMCKMYSPTDNYNNFKIGQMLIDQRSIYMYPKGVFGYRIIELSIKNNFFYRNNEIFLFFKFHTKENEEKKYTFQLKFNNFTEFQTMKNLIYNNQDHLIIIGGKKWFKSNTFNQFFTTIISKKQYKLI